VTEIDVLPQTAAPPSNTSDWKYRVLVRYISTDTNREGTLQADYVIVTVPLGVLKAK
jgi:hypothetical protein